MSVKILLHRGDATGTTTQRDRSKWVWINQNLSKNWAKPSSTTEDGKVVIIYGNNKERWIWQPYPEQRNHQESLAQCRSQEKRSGETARFPSRTSTRLANPFHVLGCKGTASFWRGSLPWSPTGAEWGTWQVLQASLSSKGATTT